MCGFGSINAIYNNDVNTNTEAVREEIYVIDNFESSANWTTLMCFVFVFQPIRIEIRQLVGLIHGVAVISALKWRGTNHIEHLRGLKLPYIRA